MKGRRSNAKLAEFGEIVHFKIPKTNSMPGKFEDVWEDGVWIGCDMRSGENLIGMKNGVFRASTIRRKPMDSRLSRDRVKEMRGSPKQPVPGQAYNRSLAFSRKYGMEARPDEPFIAQPVPESTAIRNWHIRKADVEKYGATTGCTACKYVLKGTAHHGPHTVQCRKRIQELIMDTEEGIARMDRALGRAMGRPPGEPPGEGGG